MRRNARRKRRGATMTSPDRRNRSQGPSMADLRNAHRILSAIPGRHASARRAFTILAAFVLVVGTRVSARADDAKQPTAEPGRTAAEASSADDAASDERRQ